LHHNDALAIDGAKTHHKGAIIGKRTRMVRLFCVGTGDFAGMISA
jgi:putative protein kinase ArgK-like GTPase of G3E family